MESTKTAELAAANNLKSDKDINGSIHHDEDQSTLVLETAEERDARIAARATLQNALHGIPKARLYEEVDSFCRDHKLEEHQDIVRKGALLAQKPDEWATLDELSEDDKAAVDFERSHK
jgi:hypothetical protein